MSLALATKTSDWEIAGRVSISVAFTVGGGIWFFEMRSKQLAVREAVMFAGYGLGADVGKGAGAGGVDVPTGDEGFGALLCERAFSLCDLHGAGGRLTTAGLQLLSFGYSKTYVSAFDRSYPMFDGQPCDGPSVGGGAIVKVGGLMAAGQWRVVRLINAPDAGAHMPPRPVGS